MLENDKKIINEFLENSDEENKTYLLTNKNYKNKNISKKDIEKKINKFENEKKNKN